MSSNKIASILKQQGPMLTTHLAEILIQTGVSSDAARQQISRARPPVRKLSGLTFGKRSRLIYHEEDYNSGRYWAALFDALRATAGTYASVISAFEVRNQVMPTRHFTIHSGAPNAQKKQIAASEIYKRLVAIKILQERVVPGVGACAVLAPVFDADLDETDIANLKARLIAEDVLLLAIKDWARKLGLVSYDRVEVRDRKAVVQPTVGTCSWDLAAPSYLSPLVKFSKEGKPQPGFLVCDVLLVPKPLAQEHVEPFVRKLRLLKQLVKLSPVVPMLVCDSYTPEAFKLLKSNGVIAATPTNLFGKEVAEGLAALMDAVSSTAKKLSSVEQFGELFQRLSHIEGAAGNLRGALFELIIARLIEESEGGDVSINRIFKDAETGNCSEVDVVQVRKFQSVRLVECKGYAPHNEVNLEAVQKWTDVTIPRVRKSLKQDPHQHHLEQTFEYWVAGKFSDEAKAHLVNAASSVKKYKIKFMEYADIREYVKGFTGSPLKKLLDDHFLKHPLSSLA